jgi:hypothetical protein
VLPSAPAETASFLQITPLPDWHGSIQTLAPGLSIRPLDSPERAALEFSDTVLRFHSIEAAARAGHWLCYEFENSHPPENVRYRLRHQAAVKLIHHALYAVQILFPIGAPNLSVLYRRDAAGLQLETAQYRPPFLGTVWARRCDVPESFAADVPTVLDRVREVFRKPVLRLQIPIRLLLWATGLDGVTHSGGVSAFAERLCALIGGGSDIFPPCSALPRPKYKVAEVVEHLYLLRTQMAHGLPFHEQFRKTRGFLAADGRPLSEEFAKYRYDQVLEECSAFLLCKALREVLLRLGEPGDPDRPGDSAGRGAASVSHGVEDIVDPDADA